VGDCNYLPFLKESFDLIVCGEIIEHLHAPKRLLAETSMLLKHGGEMIITTPNADNIFRRILYRFNLAMNQEHVHEFNLKELNILLEGHSLKIKKSLFINFNIFPIGEYSLSKFPKSFLTFVYIPINDLIEKLPFVNSLLCDTIIIKAEKE
jgi:SAM-dependent methyltransferase